MNARLLAAPLALLLAACGAAPVPTAHLAAGHRPAVRSEAARHVALHIPAEQLAYARQAVEDQGKDFAKDMVLDMYGRPMYPRFQLAPFSPTDREQLVLHVSRDDFKTTLQEITMFDGRALGADLTVPFYDVPGPVTYYLEVHASKVETETGKTTPLPVKYVSNFGHNFRGELQ